MLTKHYVEISFDGSLIHNKTLQEALDNCITEQLKEGYEASFWYGIGVMIGEIGSEEIALFEKFKHLSFITGSLAIDLLLYTYGQDWTTILNRDDSWQPAKNIRIPWKVTDKWKNYSITVEVKNPQYFKSPYSLSIFQRFKYKVIKRVKYIKFLVNGK